MAAPVCGEHERELADAIRMARENECDSLDSTHGVSEEVALRALARDASSGLATRLEISHDVDGVDAIARGRASVGDSYIGENLASGALSVDAVIRGWLASPAHRRTLCDPEARRLGVGVCASTRRHQVRVYVAEFSR